VNYNEESSVPLDTSVDAGLIVTPHKNFDFEIWRKSSVRVFDLSAGIENYGWIKFF
jgi:hypothetical protein